ncbi:hypothetical protein AY601_2046 [Pedobacter cryoconitis]|uniref:Uncharacterized protein n=1 Tax=Pedobacter cryoconitis TaxID=188932 RepID=A0A127VCJ2_9SPHI|nr:hypothetical protein [Pedobacter cryoconitis]AMP98949.1 hypothetical protein AY601_2046 [Pedobacter cryoconitis]
MSLFNDLFKAGIIKEQEVVELNKALEHSTSEPNEVLEVLCRFYQEKILADKHNTGTIWTNSLPQEDHKDYFPDEPMFLKFVEILYRNEVISEIAYQKIKRVPLKGDQFSYCSVLHLSIEFMSFSRFFSLEEQLAFAELLSAESSNGSGRLINEQEKEKLFFDIKAGKLKTNLDFFSYCHGCRFIELSAYKNKEQDLLKNLVKILNELIDDAFSILEITTYKEDFKGARDDCNKQRTVIIDTGNRKHQYCSIFFENETRTEYNPKIFMYDILRFVNQMLADFNRSYRLTGISNNLHEQLFQDSKSPFAICRFREENNNVLDFYDMQQRFLIHTFSPLLYKSPLSYTHIQYAFYHIKKCGLLFHLGDEQLDTIMSDVYKNTYSNIRDLFDVFPDMTAFASHMINAGQKPYRDFLLALNHISHGVLNFTEISDGIPGQFNFGTAATFKISFKCNGNYHELDYDLIGKEFNDKIIYYLINEIIQKQYNEYQLIQLANNSHQYNAYLFVTKQQREYLESMKIIEIDHPGFHGSFISNDL